MRVNLNLVRKKIFLSKMFVYFFEELDMRHDGLESSMHHIDMAHDGSWIYVSEHEDSRSRIQHACDEFFDEPKRLLTFAQFGKGYLYTNLGCVLFVSNEMTASAHDEIISNPSKLELAIEKTLHNKVQIMDLRLTCHYHNDVKFCVTTTDADDLVSVVRPLRTILAQPLRLHRPDCLPAQQFMAQKNNTANFEQKIRALRLEKYSDKYITQVVAERVQFVINIMAKVAHQSQKQICHFFGAQQDSLENTAGFFYVAEPFFKTLKEYLLRDKLLKREYPKQCTDPTQLVIYVSPNILKQKQPIAIALFPLCRPQANLLHHYLDNGAFDQTEFVDFCYKGANEDLVLKFLLLPNLKWLRILDHCESKGKSVDSLVLWLQQKAPSLCAQRLIKWDVDWTLEMPQFKFLCAVSAYAANFLQWCELSEVDEEEEYLQSFSRNKS